MHLQPTRWPSRAVGVARAVVEGTAAVAAGAAILIGPALIVAGLAWLAARDLGLGPDQAGTAAWSAWLLAAVATTAAPAPWRGVQSRFSARRRHWNRKHPDRPR